jgi:circadian clock protein KaiB
MLLRLYVAGRTHSSRQALQHLERILQKEIAEHYEFQVIDILEHPYLAEKEKIFATPTLVKGLPPQVGKIIGDLSQWDKALVGLDIVPRQDSNPKDGG